MKRQRIANFMFASLAALLFAAGNVSAQNDAAAAKAKADASASAKAKLDASATAKAATDAKSKADAIAKAKADADTKASASANTKVTLDGPTLTTVRARLFGTPDNGLLDGKGSFNFRAENMKLTAAESVSFFTSADSSENLAALVRASEALHGEVWLRGTIDGQPFEMKIAGREMKLEGLTLTTAQRDSLIVQLRGIEGLKEMKIAAVVDGKQTVTKVQGGQEKVEILGSRKPERDARGDKTKVDTAAKVEAKQRIDGPARIEGSQRIEGVGRIETPGRGLERVERVVPGLGRR